MILFYVIFFFLCFGCCGCCLLVFLLGFVASFFLFLGDRENWTIFYLFILLYFICESEKFCGSHGTKRGTIFNDFVGGRLATLH